MLWLMSAVIAFFVFFAWRVRTFQSRSGRVSQYVFPPGIQKKLLQAYPHLTDAQAAVVMNGLREYFQISLEANRRMVSMPSKAVDTAWHEFILHTKNYQQFCREALGRFLHHTPAEAMHTPTMAQEGIKRAWRLSCKREGIDPASPARLPLLFAIDSLLNIPDGYRYSLNCQPGLGAEYCASHIGCGGGCGGSSGTDGCGGDSSDGGGGDGGGDGGGGCGGGGD